MSGVLMLSSPPSSVCLVPSSEARPSDMVTYHDRDLAMLIGLVRRLDGFGLPAICVCAY